MSRAGRPSARSAKRRALYLLAPIPDDAPTAFKNGLAIRNAATTSGVCPDCGASGELRGPDEDGFLHLVFEHEHGCGALTDYLGNHVRRQS